MSDITVPQLGESVSEATVGEWQISEGDAVKKDDILVELETDKVSVEVRAEADGTLTSIAAKEGETVEIGAKLGELGSGEAKASQPKGDKGNDKKEASASKASGDEGGASGSGELIDAKVPVMGESVSEGTAGEWAVKVGDTVEKDQTLLEIETDKVAVEVPSPEAGEIEELLVSEGDSVEPGQVIAKIRAGASGGSASKSKSKDEAKSADKEPARAKLKPSGDDAKAMPSAQRVARENDLDLSKVEGSGKDGRVTKGDALKALESGASAPAKSESKPSAPRELGEREERVKMTRLRQTIARRLKEAQNSAAMLTTYNEADMSAIMSLRKQVQDDFTSKHGVKLGFMSFFVKACVTALQDIPAVNAEIDGTDIIYKNHYDVGVAVGTDKGLVVPVVRDCDTKSLAQIEKDIIDLGKRARDGKLSIDDMQGATFTISNGGVYGSLMSSPILNAPQSGILGMHKIQERPMAINGEVKIRPMMYLALSYDHRIVDGKEAVTFLVRVKESLEKPERLILDI
ncbi:dihydrolipoyllysine-residue succinyltransferase component of 2-oxoglutarate dehydrogenase complex [Marinicauda pacifica]|uniref:Dihydrolipoyllysine-residue succinyltransferase component of 2-oxoglutarate dehydrogenase complex n=1 Tax=Marinicauda pacifica TaxID=1133559 RepID=A0A4S2H951_9PROT|nr:2-oxoglutarate dehydrogenase complex dihydrolipoyllysine-residue succinyltransferase [Marinicauda pacifica]TGY92385.1 2-oxoglutarate dehydrogenase complex dihydrolipoyllysine-residue succinyltransferase [Marinicauda pacifica]GGE48426.1 dihydrolipoyllysine-residue succinyltransferase component of 2-oxoglutarate dehydrogenase complex [Marinicauda pacifica]